MEEDGEEAQSEKNKQYVLIEEIKGDIVVIGVYDTYEDAEDVMMEEINVVYDHIDNPLQNVFEKYEKNNAVAYVTDDVRKQNFEIHRVSQ